VLIVLSNIVLLIYLYSLRKMHFLKFKHIIIFINFLNIILFLVLVNIFHSMFYREQVLKLKF